MKTGDKVTVIPSSELLKLGLSGLEGRQGEVVEMGNFKRGAWVAFDPPFNGETEWYIPNSSLSAL